MDVKRTSDRSMRPRGELALIEAIRRRAKVGAAAVRLGIGDDCSVLRPPAGHDLLVTTDMSLEGRHFQRATHPAASVGHRCLTRGLSDVAAMGGVPLAAFLSLALPAGLPQAWTDGFLEGLLRLAEVTRTPLAGGDTAAAAGDGIAADIVIVAAVPAGDELRRSTARPGDLIYVTGSLGGAAAELAQVLRHPRRFRSAQPDGDHPHLFPQARLRAGALLRSRGIARAAIDISDGLSTDLHHICVESGLSAELEAERLPLHPLARALGAAEGVAAALHGGEDYELLFTAAPQTRVPRRIGGTPVTRIGAMLRPGRKSKAEPRMWLVDEAGRRAALQPGGWEHAL